jgi:hypothetical protein
MGQKVAQGRYPTVLKKVGEAPERHGSWGEEGEGDGP